MAKTYYIGLSVTYHDPAIAIVNDRGEAVFAEATERHLQYKRALNCEPDNIHFVPALLKAFCSDAERFVIAFNWRRHRPWYEQAMAALGVLSAEGLMRRGVKRLRSPLRNDQIHHMMACNRNALRRGGLNLRQILAEEFPSCPVAFKGFDHHDAHAALACYGSPFDAAACAVVDSYGERGSLALYRYADGRLERVHEGRGLGSLGLWYMRLTELCGFDWHHGEEWKVMGLAAYGRFDEAIYGLLKQTLTVRGLNLEHPRATTFDALKRLDGIRRIRRDPIERAADLACTGQAFFSDVLAQLLRNFHDVCGGDRLALAGGCALNSSFNGRLTETTPFRELYVPPAPADDGTALGAAWLAFYRDHPGFGANRIPLSPYLGSDIDDDALNRLVRYGQGLHVRHLPGTVEDETARLLADGKLVGRMQGRAEYGPRALGNRSILADPRDPEVKARINASVKFREDYRPFAPAILHEQGPDYFEAYRESPYMERSLRFRSSMAERVPGVVHVDGTGRLQTVRHEWNPRFHRLVQAFHRRTGVPMLLNTSLNVMGKPMVHSVEDAIGLFMSCGLDVLVIGNWLFSKQEPR